MRRLLVTTLVFLLLGAFITVLTAWACAAISKRRVFDARLLGRLRVAQYENEDRLAKAGIIAASEIYLSRVFVSTGTRLLMLYEDDARASRQRQQHAAGWPALALQAEQISSRGSQARTRWGAPMGTIDLEYQSLPASALAAPVATAPASAPFMTPARGAPVNIAPAPPLTMAVAPREKADHLLPLRPIWPGFGINTLVYTVMAWLLWLAFVAAMRIQRRWRGRCGHCAYPIGTSPVCSECGRKVRPSAKLTT